MLSQQPGELRVVQQSTRSNFLCAAVEEKKRPGSLLRRLTKKRPASMPPNLKGNADSKAKGSQPEPPSRTEILPDVLFHGMKSICFKQCHIDYLSSTSYTGL